MNRVCVVTSRAQAYYVIVSRLRKAGLQFASMRPDSDYSGCELVLTTAAEVGQFGGRAVALEDLDGDPGVFKGQIASHLVGGDGVAVIGVDPGARIGMAVFYGETGLAFDTFDSVSAVSSRVGAFVRGVHARRFVVRIGNGDPATAARLVESLKREAPDATVEVVDESGTSVRSVRMKGVQGDQSAAAKIAFRKGEVVSPGNPRTRE